MFYALLSLNRRLWLVLLTALTVSAQAIATPPVTYNDPWEPMNRSIFVFNDRVDRCMLRPVAKGYHTVVPPPIRQLVTNFFRNLGEVRNTVNATLQGKGKAALISVARLALNSTLGMLGLVDVASPMGLERQYQDFGLTLARWGVPSGPYIVLPLLGSSTLRAGIGVFPDVYVSPVHTIKPESDQWAARGVDAVNVRATLLDVEDLIVGDRYAFIRDTYWQRREFLITDELPEDDF